MTNRWTTALLLRSCCCLNTIVVVSEQKLLLLKASALAPPKQTAVKNIKKRLDENVCVVLLPATICPQKESNKNTE